MSAKGTASSAWLMVIFAMIVLIVALLAMWGLGKDVTAGDVAALAAAVLGVVGTHVGHVAGHELATGRSHEQLLMDLHRDGKLDDQELAQHLRRLYG